MVLLGRAATCPRFIGQDRRNPCAGRGTFAGADACSPVGWGVPRRCREKDALPLPAILALGALVIVLLHPRWLWLFMTVGLLATGLFIWFQVKTAHRKRAAALKLRDLQALTPRELELHVA